MAFKRSAVRSRLSPPTFHLETVKFWGGFFVFINFLGEIVFLTFLLVLQKPTQKPARGVKFNTKIPDRVISVRDHFMPV